MLEPLHHWTVLLCIGFIAFIGYAFSSDLANLTYKMLTVEYALVNVIYFKNLKSTLTLLGVCLNASFEFIFRFGAITARRIRVAIIELAP
jgi:hypothetical protein